MTTHAETTVKDNPIALIPFLVFLLFYLGLSLWSGDFYSVPMPLAFLVAGASAFLLNRPRTTLAEKVECFARGMGESNIMVMCLIFILAGAFAATAKAAGAVDATVLICRHLIPEQLILGGFFLISALISLAIGTSCGTIAAVLPIAVGLVEPMQLSPALMAGAVIGGAMFGDNLSMISDTTIAATRTQGVAMRDKFLVNLKMVLPVALIALMLYTVLGLRSATGDTWTTLPTVSGWELLFTVPYLLILLGAMCGMNVMLLLFSGTVLSIAVGCLSGKLTFWAALASGGSGIQAMSETLIVALLAGGLLHMIRHNGGIDFLLTHIERRIRAQWQCEFGVMLLVGCVNLFTANNTVAIVVSGPIARLLATRYACDPRRIAGILDTASCAVQGIIPYGAQLLIAIGILKNAGIPLHALELIGALYYPFLLGIALVGSISLHGMRLRKFAR